jgi:hypothetical protein
MTPDPPFFMSMLVVPGLDQGGPGQYFGQLFKFIQGRVGQVQSTADRLEDRGLIIAFDPVGQVFRLGSSANFAHADVSIDDFAVDLL